MGIRKLYFGMALFMVIVLVSLLVGSVGGLPQLQGGEAVLADSSPNSELRSPSQELVVAQAGSQDPLVLSYAVKFVCLEPLQPGQLSYASVVPLVKEATQVLVHNPNDFAVTLYKKAVRAPLEEAPPIAPGKWRAKDVGPDYAFRMDCDDITKLLTGNDQATFLATYGIGVKVEGFVVIGIGPQTSSAGTTLRYSPLDVVGEYSRGSEVLKKDIGYQPWWRWWWWGLPWRLGYAYQRILPISDPTLNIDCRADLYKALNGDVDRDTGMGQVEQELTKAALAAGQATDPTSVMEQTGDGDEPALVAMIGRCDKIDPGSMSVDYILLSNKTSTDPDPSQGTQGQPDAVVYYPWIPGHWYDLTVVMPQNVTKDIDAYMRDWHTAAWIRAGAQNSDIATAMTYFFPYWCGWGYWWWWWNGSDCIDIGVGEGESIDVEQITPVRVFMQKWPPIP